MTSRMVLSVSRSADSLGEAEQFLGHAAGALSVALAHDNAFLEREEMRSPQA